MGAARAKRHCRPLGRGLAAFVVAIFLPLLVAAVGSPALGQGLGRVISPIVTLDRDALFSRTLFGQRINAELKAASEAMAAETRRIEAELTAEEDDLTARRASMDPEEFRKLANAFDEKVQALREERAKAESDLAAQVEAAKTQFFEKVTPVLGALLRERGAVIVLDRRAILLSLADVDVTDEAVARIDSVLGDGADAPGADGLGGGTAGDGPTSTAPAPQLDSSTAAPQ
ncbi:MAG: OmpH family outer membrane protein [Alphaproteobacteria bacterium]|nr:MAG: OmpH family outer membrane protein [Alphaproteobacteria bacterium]